jgi:site-specific DNA recombinase
MNVPAIQPLNTQSSSLLKPARISVRVTYRSERHMPVRAAIYARYSSEMQRDASVEDQVRLCRERICQEGWTLVQVYVDRAISGASTLRPGYQGILEGAREAEFDVVVAEGLDRLSRDQEDVAALFKRLTYAGIRLVTLAEGQVSELHVGLKGTMNALFLKDLADKVRRGLRGRVENGKSAGGNSYGYDVVKRFDARGEPVRGDRTINQAEAAVVRQIFVDYAAGVSPRQIALRLNEGRVSAPRGGAWSSSTINGNRARGTGILNNEIYIGRAVWNRLRYGKDPETGGRRSRANADGAVVTVAVPESRIVSDELWEAVRARQTGLDRKADVSEANQPHPAPFWSKQRPRYLFSGLMQCGVCGGGFSKISQNLFGCSTARNKGETACTNRVTIRRDVLESTVLDGLEHRLMNPELFKVFVAEFTAEWNRLQAAVAGNITSREAELKKVKASIERLVDALENGTPAEAVNERLKVLEARRIVLVTELASSVSPAPRLHPNLAEVYRQKVAALAEALTQDDTSQAREMVRGLVEAIVLVPEEGRLRVQVRGELAAILSLSSAPNTKGADISAGALSEQVKMVAGIGFEPMTFRL